MQATLSIGITGGIGGGKSEVCRIFLNRGAEVIDADALARELMNSHPAIQRRLRREFGDHIFAGEGTISKKAMARLVFTDDSARTRIHAIVHPVVIEEISARIAHARHQRTSWGVIVEAALIYEAGVDHLFDFIIVVTAEKDRRIDRVAARDGLTADEILNRMHAQMSDEDKCTRADFVIHNNSSRADLEARCLFIENIVRALGPQVPDIHQ